jgi:hypothetical protein
LAQSDAYGIFMLPDWTITSSITLGQSYIILFVGTNFNAIVATKNLLTKFPYIFQFALWEIIVLIIPSK